jgi:hypothetical protein
MRKNINNRQHRVQKKSHSESVVSARAPARAACSGIDLKSLAIHHLIPVDQSHT